MFKQTSFLALFLLSIFFNTSYAQIPNLGVNFDDSPFASINEAEPSTGFVQRQVDSGGRSFVQTMIVEEVTPPEEFVQVRVDTCTTLHGIRSRPSVTEVPLPSNSLPWNFIMNAVKLPIVEYAEPIIQQAYGPITPVTFESFYWSSEIKKVYVNGETLPVENGYFGLPAGQHHITLPIEDNWAATSFDITVIPKLLINTPKRIKQGDKFDIVFNLTGDAVDYPVTVKYFVWSDFDSSLAFGKKINITSDRQATVEIDTSGLCNTPIRWDVESSSTLNRYISEQSISIVTDNFIINEKINMEVTQAFENNFYQRRIIFNTAGLVQIAVMVDDQPITDLFSLDWSQTDDRLVPLNGWDKDYIEFNPSDLQPGTYSVIAQVFNKETGHIIEAERLISIVDSTTTAHDKELQAQDWDDDGILDIGESEQHIIPMRNGRNDRYLAFTEFGLTLSLGELAFTDQLQQASLSEKRVHNLVSESAIANVAFESAGSLDVIMSGVEYGGSAHLVVPLTQHADRLYVFDQKYQTWKEFDSIPDKVFTVFGYTGICPFIDDRSYQEADGHYFPCVKFFIKDGGPNDGDGKINGEIALRMVARAAPPPPIPSWKEANTLSETNVLSAMEDAKSNEVQAFEPIKMTQTISNEIVTDFNNEQNGSAAQISDLDEKTLVGKDEPASSAVKPSSSSNSGGGAMYWLIFFLFLRLFKADRG